MEKIRDPVELRRKIPSHEITYCRLRDMILFGQLAPGQPVTIQGLTTTLEAGMTPVREAIRKLTAEGALELRDNRRVSVPQLTQPLLDELAFARLTIEPKLAQLAAKRLRAKDISDLSLIDADLDRAIATGDVHHYLMYNFRFHFTLYEYAGAPILLSLTHMLWLRFGPSLRVVCGRFGTSNLPDRHEEALEAMRAGDAERLAAALESDIAQGIEQVRLSLDDGAI
ncbi:HTH-type transcriptional regulator McbR [Defluviimonas aquaemixtae]|uniref:HTH-type transcriptional regulator McbR n=1 Tax=Albidovulum aquaemixtae TaxID=1542388 RepID=A0A2R8B7G3_9RHOB|nr:GntR family transcriptional regulator [Defluviimonas aquaemixtae]SPH18567.1 HTH-type transcriptional regulator McbR [Defluviimonas aquaemixtae]